MERTYKIAGIDVHKSMLAVVLADAAKEGAFQFQRRKFTTLASGLEQLAAWLRQEDVQDYGAVLEAGMAATGRAMQTISGTGAIQPRAEGPQGGLQGRRAPIAPACGRGTDSELCTEPRAAAVAHHDP